MNQELPHIYTVSALTREIRDRLETYFSLVWVSGEISNLRQPLSGHYYFTIKDASAQLRGVLFKGSHQHMRCKPQEGSQFLCRGRLTVYEPRGEYQLIVDYLEPLGQGALAQAFEVLKNRLRDEGLFAPELKKPLPFLPRKIALVTSPTGAAVRDFLRLLRQRFPNVEVLIYPVKVQGAEAAGEIAQALDDLSAYPGVEVIVLARGGGSLEDLWPFNEELVARAIHRCPIPVVSAVGHEVDFTIADFVADRRAPTPSAAVELVVPDLTELNRRLGRLGATLAGALARRRDMARQHLMLMARRLPDVRRSLVDLRLKVDEKAETLVRRTRRAADPPGPGPQAGRLPPLPAQSPPDPDRGPAAAGTGGPKAGPGLAPAPGRIPPPPGALPKPAGPAQSPGHFAAGLCRGYPAPPGHGDSGRGPGASGRENPGQGGPGPDGLRSGGSEQ